jgi:hypothetical protein
MMGDEQELPVIRASKKGRPFMGFWSKGHFFKDEPVIINSTMIKVCPSE